MAKNKSLQESLLTDLLRVCMKISLSTDFLICVFMVSITCRIIMTMISNFLDPIDRCDESAEDETGHDGIYFFDTVFGDFCCLDVWFFTEEHENNG
jgi:hypothetical protein